MPDNSNTNRGCKTLALHGKILFGTVCLTGIAEITMGTLFIKDCPENITASICMILTGISTLALTIIFLEKWGGCLKNCCSKKTVKWIIVCSTIVATCLGLISAILGVAEYQYPSSSDFCDDIEYFTSAILFTFLVSISFSIVTVAFCPIIYFYSAREEESEEVIVYTVHAVAVNVTTTTQD